MKHALISPNEPILNAEQQPVGQRLVEVADAPFPVAEPLFWIEVPDETDAGSVMWNGTSIAPLPTPAPAPVTLSPISAMQLSGALFLARKITAREARDFGRAGIIPQSIEAAVIVALEFYGKTDDEVQLALLFLESATEYHRDHPLTPIIGLALDMDADALDALWVAGLQIA